MRPLPRRALLLSLPLLALAYLGVAWLGASVLRGARIDLTEHRIYTLSQGTRRILATLPQPVELELFYSERAAQSQPQFRVFAQRVRELLEEVASRSKGRVTLRITDPEPFGEDEDRASAAGLTAVPLGEGGDKLYFGLVARAGKDRQAVIPFFQPAREARFEYEVAKAISGLASTGRPVLALLTPLPMGPGIEAFTGRPTPGWVLDRQLAESFDLRRLPEAPTRIDDDVDLLMVVHPRDLPEQTEAAIDQFVLRGGRLLAFVDPDAESDASDGAADEPHPSTLPRLFAAWGVRFDPSRVVLDGRNALRIQPDPRKPPVSHLGVLGLHRQQMNQADVVTADLESVNLSSAGALSLAPDADATLEALLQSSSSAMLADAAVVHGAQSDPASLARDFRPDGGGPYVLAARLGGRLRTAFPDLPGEGRLRRSVSPANVVVVADTDLLTDGLWVQVQDFLGQAVISAFAGNADFVYNAADNLVGNDDLIRVRTRPTASRPFERVDAVRRRAEIRYQAKARQLEQQLAALEEQLARLQPAAGDGPPQVLGVAQQAELEHYQQRKAATRRELRAVQRGLNADIEAIGTRIKLLDIVAMPALVLALALLIALRRHLRRQEAGR